MRLLPFQKRIVRAVERPSVDTVVVSLPRGNGKSSLIAHLAGRYLTPDDALFGAGREAHIIAQSLNQARRTVFRLLSAGYRNNDDYIVRSSYSQAEVEHELSGTKVSVLPASGAAAMGLVDCPLILADECGSWKRNDGELVYDALQTALGKPGCDMTVLYASTLAPASSNNWWRKLAAGEDDDVWRLVLKGDHKQWDSTPEIRRVNPLKWAFAKSRRKLLSERDKARRDSEKQRAFLSYSLNYPVTADEAQLLDHAKWSSVLARPVPERSDVPPIVGLDLGGAAAWCAASAVWPSGRIECRAATAGATALDEQERRDAQPAGTYAALQRQGVLDVHEGLHVPDVARFLRGAMDDWGRPHVVMVDRYRRGELKDAVAGLDIPVEDRPVSWEAQTEDIGRTRRVLLDGCGAVESRSRGLLTLAVAESRIQSDDSGNCKVVKRRGNRSRDDALQSLVLAVAEAERCEPDIGHGDTCE